MAKRVVVRRALTADPLAVDSLLSEWFDWKPQFGRLGSVKKAIRKRELLVAQAGSGIVGFIHYVLHEDVIDGGPNSFITAFYLSPACRGKGVGSLLLGEAITDSLARGAVGVETSTIHAAAKELYEKHEFKQTMGDIGEVFLELDMPGYLRVRKTRPCSKR